MDSKDMQALYRKRARFYDITANVFYLIGFREWAYRKKAVAALNLCAGDTVVEIGCGTGLNISLLQNRVGPTVNIIGIDFSDAMLKQAQKRIDNNGWDNISLIESDAAAYEFNREIDGVITTFAIKAMPAYESIIQHAAKVLPVGKRFVILELQQPDWCPGWLRNWIIRLLSPFGATQENAAHVPWHALQNNFKNTYRHTYYCGVAYIAYCETMKNASNDRNG